jgi:superfamily II DNA/RNA helicase
MLLAQDGSGKGAAFVAAIAKKIKEQNLKKSSGQ